MNITIVILLVILSGLFSGLTLGLFSLGLTPLKRKMKLGDKRAKKIYSVRKNATLLLCTLLLGNVAVNSAIAVFLGSIADGLIAGLVATGLITVFGEILPQAMFTRYAMIVGSNTIWLVRFFQIILYPVAKPLSLILDYILGEELPSILTKQELQEIIKDHEDSPDSSLDADEERIILGAMSFSEKKAEDIMTPKTVVYYLRDDVLIDGNLLKDIKQKGFSRIPVYSTQPDDMIGILYTKDLIGYDDSNPIKVKDFLTKRDMLSVDLTTRLDNLLNLLISKRLHIAFVYNEFGVFNGIVTLEDVIEEILKVEIVDEADKFDDMQKLAKLKFKRNLT